MHGNLQSHLFLTLRGMTGETELAVKDAEAEKYVSAEDFPRVLVARRLQGQLLMCCVLKELFL